MDHSRFDTLTKTFAVSRRQAVKLALGGTVAGLLGLTGGSTGQAARRGFSGPFATPTPTAGCTIAGESVPANTVNLNNSCQRCDPALDPGNWSPIFGAFCGDGSQVCCDGECCPTTHCCSLNETCIPCRCEIDDTRYDAGTSHPTSDCLSCDPSQSTSAWSPLLDQTSCGGVSGRVCCNGECCSPTECCNSVACEECGPHCHIGGQDIDAGITNPNKDCEICNPDLSFDSWSPADDGALCNEGGGSCCTEGVCGACSCIINGEPVPDGDVNPNDDCERCLYFEDPNNWSDNADRAPCEDDRECCDGKCCPANQCCSVDGCEPCCRIGTQRVDDGDVKQGNTCQICDASRDGHDWTAVRDGEVCGSNGNSECCNGECCPSGQCCRNGECGLCDCQIGPAPVPPNTINLANPCEICDPARNRSDWSSVGTGASCDANGGTCCDRDCCASDLCCLLEACGECLCSIDNVNRSPQEPHPTIDCLECNPQADPFGWSTSPDRTACGDGTQQCCGGSCCDPGFCCIDGSCQTCGCMIEGTPIAIGTPNPNNSCQKCDPTRDPLGWSLLDEGTICDESGAQCCKGGECEFCSCLIEGVVIAHGTANPLVECQVCDVGLFPGGWSPSTETSNCGDGTQICCNSACCPIGNCCNLTDVCEPCRCEIEEATFEPRAVNPDNACLYCDPGSSTTTWTFELDYAVCSDPLAVVNRYCCQGVCCEEHACCLADGTCGECKCTIEGVDYNESAHNPANDRQYCSPTENQTGWMVAQDGDICGPAFDKTCCSGQCAPCEPGCVIDGVHYDEFARKPGNFCEYCDPRFPDQWSPSQGGDCPPACQIGGEIIRYGTPNPDNICQICRGGNDWSPSSELFCGDGTQACCVGACCELDACCTAEGVCAFEGCELQGCVIDGTQHEDGEINPDNPCQFCEISSSTTSWTARFSSCGPTDEQFCCEGACCDLGACCNPSGVCDYDACETCVIAGALYLPAERNPANGCQVCSANSNKFDWTLVPDNNFCDDTHSVVCCVGTCCNPGEGCIQGVCQPI